jgi:hypothetical protein
VCKQFKDDISTARRDFAHCSSVSVGECHSRT